MVETTGTFQSSWTLAEALIWEIAAHLKNGRTSWLNGNLEKYYWEFESIVRAMFGMLDPDEKTTAAEKEKAILNKFPITNNNKKEVSALLKEYDGAVMTFIHKHKLDVPPKKDTTNL